MSDESGVMRFGIKEPRGATAVDETTPPPTHDSSPITHHLLRRGLGDFELYCRYGLRRPGRASQRAPARAILASVLGRRGDTVTVMYARQMGKNELSAALEAYLLTLYQRVGGTLVKAAPTYRPQIVTSLLRLDGLLQNPLTAGRWRARFGYLREVGAARALFF